MSLRMRLPSERSGPGDWIAVLEAAYSLDDTDQNWLNCLMQCIAREHWSDRISAAFTFELSPTKLSVGNIAISGPPDIHEKVHTLIGSGSAGALDKLFRGGAVCTVSERIFGMFPEDEALFRKTNAEQAPDILGVVCHSGSQGRGVVLNLVLQEPRRSTPAEKRHWTRCAAHIGAGLRLRATLPKSTPIDGGPAEAIFDGSGKLYHAIGSANERTALAVLRDAVISIDRSRSAVGRSEPQEALRTWAALVEGRWSLVDRFDSDGRRFIVAVPNDPRFADPRGLSLRERQVAEYAGLGRASKEIAYILGVSSTSVENSARRAQAKLGLQSRVELTKFFAPQGLRRRLSEIVLAGERLLVGASPVLDAKTISVLSDAEQAVAALMIAGSTNRDIAERRGVSPRTIANQIQAVFAKLGVRSRGELVACLDQAGPSSVGN